jgi:hypothetical protein
LRLYTSGRMWLVTSNDEPLLESAVGEFSAGVLFRF